jgi:hypothetical protein
MSWLIVIVLIAGGLRLGRALWLGALWHSSSSRASSPFNRFL